MCAVTAFMYDSNVLWFSLCHYRKCSVQGEWPGSVPWCVTDGSSGVRTGVSAVVWSRSLCHHLPSQVRPGSFIVAHVSSSLLPYAALLRGCPALPGPAVQVCCAGPARNVNQPLIITRYVLCSAPTKSLPPALWAAMSICSASQCLHWPILT